MIPFENALLFGATLMVSLWAVILATAKDETVCLIGLMTALLAGAALTVALSVPLR